jgi:transposase-like protein
MVISISINLTLQEGVKMKQYELNQMVKVLRELPVTQFQTIMTELKTMGNQSRVNQVIEGRSQVVKQCPHCQDSQINRHGYSKGLQRYRCNTCAKTFTALTGTPLCGLHKREKWLEQAEALSEGRTLRRVAEQVGIHVSTAHCWRHRFLSSPKSSQPEILTGIAEADETYFLLSFKGKRSDLGREPRKRGGKASQRGLSTEQVPVLVARDRSGVTLDCILKGKDSESLTAALKPFIAKDVVLCSDGSKAFAKTAKDLAVEHHALNQSSGVRVEGPWHVQNINSYHSRLKGWVYHFRGVATCYLDSYLGWFRTFDRNSLKRLSPVQWLTLALNRPCPAT